MAQIDDQAEAVMLELQGFDEMHEIHANRFDAGAIAVAISDSMHARSIDDLFAIVHHPHPDTLPPWARAAAVGELTRRRKDEERRPA